MENLIETLIANVGVEDKTTECDMSVATTPAE